MSLRLPTVFHPVADGLAKAAIELVGNDVEGMVPRQFEAAFERAVPTPVIHDDDLIVGLQLRHRLADLLDQRPDGVFLVVGWEQDVDHRESGGGATATRLRYRTARLAPLALPCTK